MGIFSIIHSLKDILEGDDEKVKKSLEELGLHCNDMHILGVYESDKFREK